jgi:glucose-6-phosphate 1-dehydrogenase
MIEESIDNRFLKTCSIFSAPSGIEPFTLVIFGGAGDLTRRKLLPSILHLFTANELSKGFSILAFGMPVMTDDEYRRVVKEAVKEFAEEVPGEEQWNEFSRNLRYLPGQFEENDSFRKLRDEIKRISIPTKTGQRNVIYYMAVPPGVVPLIVEKLGAQGLSKGDFNTKIIVEKPFGRDRESAAKLNTILASVFEENQIYRIDHYLSKEPVQNILFFRFSNLVFDQMWNYNYVDNVQITVAEDLGIGHRGAFYEQTGVIRDIVQNHILQLIGLVAMEPPVSFKADFIRDEKTKIFRSIRPFDNTYIDAFTVRGQYGPGKMTGEEVVGYRQEKDVSPDTSRATFFAAKFYVDNFRWGGVPFYVRTGKRMAKRVTEICIQFKQLPLSLFGGTSDSLEPNILTLTIQPDEKISLRFSVKCPYSDNQIYMTNMVFSYRETFKTGFSFPYERLLVDCMKGDLSLFVRQDAVEAMWEVVDPVIARWESIPGPDFPNYEAGSWGPEEAKVLIEKEGRRWITV